MRGFITVMSDMPDDLSAVSSTCSPRLPKVMSEASNIAKGSAMGTMEQAA